MNLIVDIGNSTVKAAVFDGEKLLVRRRLTGHLPDALAMLADEFHPIEACAYASVGTEMPQVEQMLRHLVPNALLRVTGLTPSPLRSAYRTPETLGADRWAAVVGAAKLLPATDLMVVDVGTCITYDYVSAEGTYQGGNISLGLGMRLRALHEQTARLPLVGVAGEAPAVGHDTPTAIRSGVLQGMACEIEGYVQRFQRLHPEGRVFLTGGNAYRFAQDYEIERNDSLVEIGLNALLEYARH